MQRPSSILFLYEAPVYGLDEHLRGPRAVVGAETPFVTESGAHIDDLVDGHASIDEVLDLIPDDGEHVPVVADVARVGEAAVARDDHRTALGAEFGNREVQDVIQAAQDAVDAAAFVDVDERERVPIAQ